jgi:hypothetical protein
MKPYQHARISAHKFGGSWVRFIKVHDLIDSTKATFPSVQHRFMLHSADFGAAVASVVCGETVPFAQIRTVDVVRQHILDDLGYAVPASDWIKRIPVPRWFKERDTRTPAGLKPLQDDPTGYLVDRYGGSRAAFQPLVDFFDMSGRYYEGPEHLFLLHNALGIFLAERAFGYTLKFEPFKRLPMVREIGEILVHGRMGRIPTVQDFAATIPIEPWMTGALVRDRDRIAAERMLETP